MRTLIFALVFLVILAACIMTPQAGKMEVTIITAASGKTIVPEILPASYRLSFEGPAPMDDIELATTKTTVELVPGTWKVTVTGLDEDGLVIAQGSLENLVVLSGKAVSASIPIHAIASGTGTISVSVTWPAGQGITDYRILVNDVLAKEGVIDLEPRLDYDANWPAGDYRLQINLIKGSNVSASISEVVQVYQNLASSAAISLCVDDFMQAPSAPTDLKLVSSASSILLSWVDNSLVEMGYFLEKNVDDAGWTVLDAELPPNTVSRLDSDVSTGHTYAYRVRAFNDFGSSSYCGPISGSPGTPGQIIADHTIVDRYSAIPARYIALVKKMWLDVPGESHSEAYRIGLTILASENPDYAVSVTEAGTPEGTTDAHLRVSRASWGCLSNETGWVYGYGEEDWYTNATALLRTKAHLAYCNSNGHEIAAMGFGWCWDMTWINGPSGTIDAVHDTRWAGSSQDGPEGNRIWGLDAGDTVLTGNSVCMDTYLAATQAYIDYCTTQGYGTKVFFTTGPVDGYYPGEVGYQRHIKQEYIRNYVKADVTRILFDYADILCHDADGSQNIQSYTSESGNTYSYPVITATNLGDASIGHIGQAGALRLAKALWWMLARMAGWDGISTD